jgi:hypothetical protein
MRSAEVRLGQDADSGPRAGNGKAWPHGKLARAVLQSPLTTRARGLAGLATTLTSARSAPLA